MIKNYKIIASLLLGCVSAFAQPVLNSTDFTSDYYNSETYYSGYITGLSPGNSGPNQVWDFSSVALTLGGTFSSVPVASSPYAASFPTANYCLKSTNTDSPGDTYFDYLNVSSTNVEDLGGGSSSGIDNYTDTSILFKLPYTYNKTFSDTHQYSSYDQVSSNTMTYDAYGTLKTPYGTYTDVIRQKTVEDGSNPSYIWLKTNPFRVLMTWDTPDNVTGAITVWKYPGLGITNSEYKTVEVYPNPVNSMLNLEVPNSLIIDKVVITDLTGKIVLQQMQNIKQINVQNLTAGMYIIQAFSGEEKFQSKFVKEY